MRADDRRLSMLLEPAVSTSVILGPGPQTLATGKVESTMLGPVFTVEMLRAGRRGRSHVLRWIYAAWLCLQLLYVYDQTHAPPYYKAPRPKATQAAADFGKRLSDLILTQQFILILLVTPAFVAGAVTDEKMRGTLQNLLTAHVTPADIVLGKLGGRCAQVGALALTPLPILAAIGPVAGLPPEFLIILIAVTGLILFGLGGVSLLMSVWARQTRSAVIATYVIFLGGWWLIASGWIPGEWFDAFYPKKVLAPAVDRVDPGEAFRRLGQAALMWGGLGLVTTVLAVWRLRPAYLRQLEARLRGRLALGRVTARPRLIRDPLAWKERFVGLRVPAWAGVPVVFALAAAITAYTLDTQFAPVPRQRFEVMYAYGMWALLLATLVVGVRCSGTITGERERQTWDGLMMTPLTVPEIVRGKLRGILRSTWPYLLAFWFGTGVVGGLFTPYDPRVVAVVVVRLRRRRVSSLAGSAVERVGGDGGGHLSGWQRRGGTGTVRGRVTRRHLVGDVLSRGGRAVLVGPVLKAPGGVCSGRSLWAMPEGARCFAALRRSAASPRWFSR